MPATPEPTPIPDDGVPLIPILLGACGLLALGLIAALVAVLIRRRQ